MSWWHSLTSEITLPSVMVYMSFRWLCSRVVPFLMSCLLHSDTNNSMSSWCDWELNEASVPHLTQTERCKEECQHLQCRHDCWSHSEQSMQWSKEHMFHMAKRGVIQTAKNNRDPTLQWYRTRSRIQHHTHKDRKVLSVFEMLTSLSVPK